MLRFMTLQVALLAVVLGPRLALADFLVATSVYVNTSWRTIGPVGDLTGGGINNVGLAWEAANPGWNSALMFDDSNSAGWSNAIEVVHPNPPFLRYWFDGTETVGSSPVYFRKEFEIEGDPISGLFSFTVDDDAQIYVNGVQVVNDSNGLATTVSGLDVLPYLTTGLNLIAVKAQDQQGGQGFAGNLQLVSNVPEPSGIVLAGLGIAAMALVQRRRHSL